MGKVHSGWPATIKISQTTAWTLSIFMIIHAVVPYVGWAQRYGTGKGPAKATDPPFMSVREAAFDGVPFFEMRLSQMPISYGILHVLPAIAWCLFIPMQLSDSLRNKQPALHRLAGYATAISQWSLILTGAWFPLKHVLWQEPTSYSHADLFHLHRAVVKGYTVAAWPTFDALCLFLVLPLQAYTLFRTIQAARAQHYAEHRTWAVLNSIAGYWIAWTRVGLTLGIALGAVANFAFPASVLKQLGWPWSDEKELWEAERAYFAAEMWFGVVAGSIWLARVLKNDKVVWREKGKGAMSNGKVQ